MEELNISTEDTANLNEKMEFPENKQISLIVQDGDNTLGRIFGVIDCVMFYIKIELFFIEAESRGKGVGRKLLQEIEDIAIKEGCAIALVNIVSFSSPEFYKKKGYTVIPELKDYPMPKESYYFKIGRAHV